MKVTDSLKKKINNSHWMIRMLVLMIVRPKRFLSDYVYELYDYKNFKSSIKPLLSFLKNNSLRDNKKQKQGLLIVAGKAMNHHWNQLWTVLGGVYAGKGFKPYVITSRNNLIGNLYYKLLKIEPIYLEELCIAERMLDQDIVNKVEKLDSFAAFKNFEYQEIPLGQMALSTFGRLRATGVIDDSIPQNRQEIRDWIIYLYKCVLVSWDVYKSKNVEMLIFAEVFMEEYGGFYYGALTKNLNIVRTVGTVRDNAVVAQHLTKESDRTHHASVSRKTWEKICSYPDTSAIDNELHENFMDRYGDKWAFSKRNQINTKIIPVEAAKRILGIENNDKKIAVIFSHILYDTLFFFGEEIFPCYADWFIESVKAACKNPNVQWFVKVHPSNMWRGELEHFFGGKYEEVRLIEKHIGTLPDHVTIVYPDTPLSPYTWFQLTDYGITVRGTSGLELGALGKTVITAGTGRYEEGGFTINPQTVDEYLNILYSLPNISELSTQQKRNGVKYAYATFCMKPFTLDFFEPIPRYGKKTIFGTDDLVYVGKFEANMKELPVSVNRFVEWSMDKDSIDFMNQWPA